MDKLMNADETLPASQCNDGGERMNSIQNIDPL